jgi:phenylacetate-CoA ligase
MKLYLKIARNIILPLADIAAGTKISRDLKFLEKSQWWSIEELQEYQNKKLRALIKHAYENVPYYHHEWKKLNLNPEDIKTVGDIRKIPIIMKEDIKKNFDDFKSKDFAVRRPKPTATGGSTGEPLKFYYDWDAWSMGWACLYRGWGFAGYPVGDKIVTIGGSSLVPSQKSSFQKQVKNKIIERHVGLSAFDMSEENMRKYAEIITRYKPRFLRGYASSLYIFAKFCEENGINFPTLHVAFTTAETLFEPYRKEIENAFGVEVFNEYGVSDGGGNAMECEMHSGLHISLERCVMEFIKDNENVSFGEMGKIILTDLHNYSFPFIRYDVGDLGIPSDEKCSCGRGLPLMKSIEGRVPDSVITPDDKIIHPFFLMHLFYPNPNDPKEIKGIKQYQVIQETKERLLVKIVKEPEYNEKEFDHILENFQKYIKGMDIEMEFVDHIPIGRSGKRRYVISKVAEKYFEGEI